MSLTTDTNTYDRIAFGYRAQVLPTEELGFKAHMLSPGKVFRFADDPNSTLYKIVGGQDEWNNVHNYADNFGFFDGSCENCSADENPESCKRITFRTKFRRLDDLGNETNEGIDISVWDPRGQVKFDGSGNNRLSIELLEVALTDNQPLRSNGTRAAVFETEPKEDVGLDIYYEASNSIPLKINAQNVSMYAPLNSSVSIVDGDTSVDAGYVASHNEDKITVYGNADILRGSTIAFSHDNGTVTYATVGAHFVESDGVPVPSIRVDATGGGTATATTITVASPGGILVGMQVTGPGIPPLTTVEAVNGGVITISNAVTENSSSATFRFYTVTNLIALNPNVWQQPIDLGWFNCYSFGNGVESDRIRDDFNTPTIDNGVSASTTITEYGEERRKSS